MVSSGTPYCRAIEATTAESLAALSISDPALPMLRKTSASEPSEKKAHGRGAFTTKN
jgi:hypothetical protein